MWPRPGSRVLDVDATRFRARREELALGPLVIHCNYLINMASSEPVMRTRAIQAFHEEIVRGMALGADFLVLHPGSALGGAIEPAIARIAHGLRQAARGLRMGGLRILIENTSGMGAAVGSRFGEIRAIFDAAPDVSLGCCVDTAHTLEAGYEIRTADGLEKTLDAIESTVGLANVAVDSCERFQNAARFPRGSASAHRARRHRPEGLRAHPDASAPRPVPPAGLLGRAFILETPIDRPGDDRKNVRALWKLSGVAGRSNSEGGEGFFDVSQRASPAEKGEVRSRARGKDRRQKRRRKARAQQPVVRSECAAAM